MVRTARQGCVTPALGLNVLLAGKPRPETKLQPAAARRSPVRAGRPPLVLPRRRQLSPIGQAEARRRECGKRPSAKVVDRGCPPFAHRALIVWGSSPWTKRGQPRLRCAIDRGGSSCRQGVSPRCRLPAARELRCRGGRIRRCPHCATFPVDPSTDQCDRNPQCANGLMWETTPTYRHLGGVAGEG